jgi:thioredoxin-like negative regulator of GroEL
VKARLAVASGRTEDARALLNAITRENPSDSRAWRLLVETYLADGDLDEARRLLARARTGREPDPELELLAFQLDFHAGEGSVDSLSKLAEVLEKTPGLGERAAAVRAYAGIRAGGATPHPETLREMASRFQDEPTLQAVIASIG